MIIGQVGITSLLVLYLYSERGWTAAHAALALGGVQVGAALARVCAGRWSDLRGERVEPFRQLATVAGVLLLAGAVLGPPALMAGGIAAMSWNGLSFTAAAEISGRRQAGKAMGIQNTSMRVVGGRSAGGARRAGERGVVAARVRGHGRGAARGSRDPRSTRRRRATPRPRARGAPRITRPCWRDNFCGPRRTLTRPRWPASCGRAGSPITTSCGAGRWRTSMASGALSGSGSRSTLRTTACWGAATCRGPSGSRARS